MNAMSNPQLQSGEDPLCYYIVPAVWFSKAYPILTAKTPDGIADMWKEQIGRISNSGLMNVVERENSSDDEETRAIHLGSVSDVQRKRFDLMHRSRIRETQQQMSTMKPGLVHARDFFFLGPGAWALVKEKFDFDGYELPRPVVPSPQNTLAIQLMEEESERNTSTLIDIPPSGRFAYECITAEAGSAASLTIVPEDEEGNAEVCTMETLRPGPVMSMRSPYFSSSRRLGLFPNHGTRQQLGKAVNQMTMPRYFYCRRRLHRSAHNRVTTWILMAQWRPQHRLVSQEENVRHPAWRISEIRVL
jgi:hypothetical protein